MKHDETTECFSFAVFSKLGFVSFLTGVIIGFSGLADARIQAMSLSQQVSKALSATHQVADTTPRNSEMMSTIW